METAKLMIDAPNAHVQFDLKNLHDNSFIRCKSAEITVSDKLAAGNNLAIFDFTKETHSFGSESSGKCLYVQADNLKVEVMDDWALLKK